MMAMLLRCFAALNGLHLLSKTMRFHFYHSNLPSLSAEED
jgi:hypothetical protein